MAVTAVRHITDDGIRAVAKRDRVRGRRWRMPEWQKAALGTLGIALLWWWMSAWPRGLVLLAAMIALGIGVAGLIMDWRRGT